MHSSTMSSAATAGQTLQSQGVTGVAQVKKVAIQHTSMPVNIKNGKTTVTGVKRSQIYGGADEHMMFSMSTANISGSAAGAGGAPPRLEEAASEYIMQHNAQLKGNQSLSSASAANFQRQRGVASNQKLEEAKAIKAKQYQLNSGGLLISQSNGQSQAVVKRGVVAFPGTLKQQIQAQHPAQFSTLSKPPEKMREHNHTKSQHIPAAGNQVQKNNGEGDAANANSESNAKHLKSRNMPNENFSLSGNKEGAKAAEQDGGDNSARSNPSKEFSSQKKAKIQNQTAENVVLGGEHLKNQMIFQQMLAGRSLNKRQDQTVAISVLNRDKIQNSKGLAAVAPTKKVSEGGGQSAYNLIDTSSSLHLKQHQISGYALGGSLERNDLSKMLLNKEQFNYVVDPLASKKLLSDKSKQSTLPSKKVGAISIEHNLNSFGSGGGGTGISIITPNNVHNAKLAPAKNESNSGVKSDREERKSSSGDPPSGSGKQILQANRSPNSTNQHLQKGLVASRLVQAATNNQITKISKAAVKIQNQFISNCPDQIIQTERLAIGSKLSLSNETSAREFEMSQTAIQPLSTQILREDRGQLVVMMPPEGETGCSPKINFYPSAQNMNPTTIKRANVGQSQPVGANSQKRRQQLKTGSIKNRHVGEDNTHSSPSAGGEAGLGFGSIHPNNISHQSNCNKSVHYGLSSQSFITNSNSNGGSNPRQQNQDVGVISQTGVNTSQYNTSFYNHHRHRSSGLQVHSQGANHNDSAINSSVGAQGINPMVSVQAPHTHLHSGLQSAQMILSMPSSTTIHGSQKVTFGGGATSSSSSNPSHNRQHLSANKVQQVSSSSQQQHPTTINQKQPHIITTAHQTPVQADNKTLQIKNKSKKTAGVDASNNSSRSNSIRKRQNFGKVVRKQNIPLKSNFFSGNAETANESGFLDRSMQLHQSKQKLSQQALTNLQYTHTVEDDEQRSPLNRSQVQQQQFFSNDAMMVHQLVKKQSGVVKKVKGDIGVNRSVIVEPSTLKNLMKQQDPLLPNPAFQTPAQQKASENATPTQVQNVQELEIMKNELKSKDMLIQNLRDRLQNLEDKVNGIQQQSSKDVEENQRDKSQQRIKDAIQNLEMKLEQFRLDKELNNKKLEEMKQYSSSQHSSSRHSELTQGMTSLGRNMLGNFPAQSHLTRAQNYIPVSGSSMGFQNSLGPPKVRRSPNSLVDDLESLITITEHDEAVARATGNAINKLSQGADIFGNVYKTSAKIKTPMFEMDIGRMIGGDPTDEEDDDLNILAQGGDVGSDGVQHEEDNSCLLMLEKEWQEAQRAKLQEEFEHGKKQFLGSGPKNQGNLFDQSLISTSNLQLKNYNQTHNNIVFFFDEETMVGGAPDEAIEDIIDLNDIELAARDGKEKFIKTQKIEFSLKEMADIAADEKRRKEINQQSLSPVQYSKVGSNNNNNIVQIQNLQEKKQLRTKTEGQVPPPGFSRTLSKTTLMAKIRNAIGKQDALSGGGGVSQVKLIQQKNDCHTGGDDLKKTTPKQPRRFIVKQSQERTGSNSALPHASGQPPYATGSSNPRLKLKSKASQPSAVQSQPQFEGHQGEQEVLMKTIVQQKEKIAQTQKDALKKERELSLKLRQAIQKLNFKIQMQQTNPAVSVASAGAAQKKAVKK